MEKKYRRRNYFIDKKFQTNFIIKFSLIVILSSLAIGFLVIFLSRNFTTVAIENAKVLVKRTPDFIFPIMFQTIIIVNIIAAFIVIILTLLTSHKISGPLYRIKREIGLLKKGDLNANFKIRKKDQLQDLANSLSDLTDSLKGKRALLKEKASHFKDILKASCDDKDTVAKFKEIDDILNQFKI